MTINILRDEISRKKAIAVANENTITTLIKTLVTREEKVNLITERNPLHYMFGEYLRVRKYDEKYEDFINRIYIGRIE
jgi:urocanate hydratase